MLDKNECLFFLYTDIYNHVCIQIYENLYFMCKKLKRCILKNAYYNTTFIWSVTHEKLSKIGKKQ